MTFDELKTELGARGFDYLDEDRMALFINEAYRQITNLHVWPFVVNVETGTTGAGVVIVTDLRRIIQVTDVSVTPPAVLRKATEEELRADGEDLTLTGSPMYYYRTSYESGTQIEAFPVGGTIRVKYAQRVPVLSSGNPTPIFDEEYHPLIVDGASINAYIDSDNFTAAGSMRQLLDQKLSAMGEDYQVLSKDLDYIDVGIPYDG
jgi:hypothetical protein